MYVCVCTQRLSAKEEVKKRLRMVLVADRCGMSPASLSEMKNTIIKALQVCVCVLEPLEPCAFFWDGMW
jgi:septum formation topological specificity factor MinE